MPVITSPARSEVTSVSLAIASNLCYSAAPMTAYIYAIQCTVNNRLYIGSTTSMNKRFGQHKQRLRDGVHHVDDLLVDYEEFGVEAFEYTLLDTVNSSAPFAGVRREQELIDSNGGVESDVLYNVINPYPTIHLSSEQVQAIQTDVCIKWLPNTQVGEPYGLSTDQVHQMAIGRSWYSETLTDEMREEYKKRPLKWPYGRDMYESILKDLPSHTIHELMEKYPEVGRRTFYNISERTDTPMKMIRRRCPKGSPSKGMKSFQ